MNPYDNHKTLMNAYAFHFGQGAYKEQSMGTIKTDLDNLRESYRFIRSEDDDADESWEQRLAKKYYDKLFKEYCLADMSRYKENKIGLRWRTQKEVVSGKGQFVCGSVGCEVKDDLHSYEVNFVYRESGEEKQALVKLRLCPKHGRRLNYKKIKERERREKKERKKEKKRKRTTKLEDTGGETSDEDTKKDEVEAYKEEFDHLLQSILH